MLDLFGSCQLVGFFGRNVPLLEDPNLKGECGICSVELSVCQILYIVVNRFLPFLVFHIYNAFMQELVFRYACLSCILYVKNPINIILDMLKIIWYEYGKYQ
jgi:hypothetical protein